VKILGRDRTRLLVLLAVNALLIAGVPPFLPEPDALVPSWGSDRVLQFDAGTGTFESELVTTGLGGMDGPHSATVGPDGHVYAVSFFTDEVFKYDGGDGSLISTFVTAGLGGLSGPMDIKFGPDGNAYVASFSNGAVLRYNGATGAFIDAFVASGVVPSMTTEWLEWAPSGNLMASAGVALNLIVEFDGTSGAPVGAFVGPGAGGLLDPHGFTFGPDGNLYVASFQGNEVLRYNGATGAFIDAFVASGAGGLVNPHGPKFGPDGNLYVTSWGTNEVLRYNGATGAFIDVFITPGAEGLVTPQVVLFREANPWADLGFALAGTNGDPELSGTGSLEPFSALSITVSNALASSAGTLFLGLSNLSAPFKGGTLVPFPFLTIGLPTAPGGGFTLPATWPGNLPSGFTFYLQYWLVDPAGPVGLASTNGLSGTTP
jgi:hypothetical protein